jgi:RNA polymerase sigma-70 factor (ECF subfamily)
MSQPPSTRASLLLRLRDHQDEEAWGEFVTIYTPMLRRLAGRRGLQEADASDLAQDVFRAVAGAIERYDLEPSAGSFRGWLFTITRNLILNLLAARQRQPRGSGDSDLRDLLEAQPAPDPDDTALFESEYQRGVLDWAVGRVRGEFHPAVWEAFWRTGVEGKPPHEVAESLQLSLGTVYQYKSRVVVRLRREIERLEGKPADPD